jgi:tetratricopeptide (TPR) repeat protein
MNALTAGAEALRMQGDDCAAVALLEAGLTADPGNADGWFLLARIHRDNDDSLASLAALERLIAMRPDDAELAYLRARVRLDAGFDAVDAFAGAIALDREATLPRLGLVAALVAAGAADQAESLLVRELKIDPAWIAGQVTLAKHRYMAGDKDWSRDFDRALGILAAQPKAWLERIALAMHVEDYAGALDLAERAAQATKAREPWLPAIASCLDELGRYDAAARLFAQAMPPADSSVAIRMVRHYLRAHDTHRALAIAEPWLNRPEAADFWPYVALVWRLMGDSRAQWLEETTGLVSTYQLSLAPDELEALAARLRSLHAMVRQPVDQSLRGGTQTDGYLLARVEPEFRRLRTALIEAVGAHIKGLPRRDPFHPTLKHRRDRPIRFAGAWSVRLAQGGFHVAHVHPLGWFSSALYLGLPDPDPTDPEAGRLVLGEPGSELGLPLTPLATIEPGIGKLVLFPSFMWHGTRRFGQGERLTVALDVALPSDHATIR